MGFMDAVKVCFSKYVVFSGRARRSEYWWFFLFQIILSVVASIIAGIIGFAQLPNLVSLALFLPSLAAGVRRMHDIGKSGWFIIIPIYNIILAVQDTQAGDNQYGPNPKGASAVPPAPSPA